MTLTMFTLLHISKQFTITCNQQMFNVDDRVRNVDKGAVRRSTKLANFRGRGLVAEENRPMKSFNHDTRYLSRHDSDDKNGRR